MGSEIANEKISGYLEKKGKIRVVGGWKKYWFVLESRLLLYYRSKEEYEAISPCKGSISLGPPCSIKPALAATCIFQIESRSHTITLRAENRFEQDKWMQAILCALNVKPTRMSHFRYSADDLAHCSELINASAKKQRIFSRQNTMPIKKDAPLMTHKGKLSVLHKLRRISSDPSRSLDNIKLNSSSAHTLHDTNNHSEIIVKETDHNKNSVLTREENVYDECQYAKDKLYSTIADAIEPNGRLLRRIAALVASDRPKRALDRKRSFVQRVLRRITTKADEETRPIPAEAEGSPQRSFDSERIAPSVSNADLEMVFNYEFDEMAFPKRKDIRPSLPPRHKLTDSHYHQHPFTPLPTEPFHMPRLQLKRPRSTPKLDQQQTLKTIDEILDDLDRDKIHRQTNAEHTLVFSDDTSLGERVVPLRATQCAENRQKAEENDLNGLLEELRKVTNAPILNSNSLVYQPETGDEWIKMIPIRKRTYSDPDYDVPRPHSSAMFGGDRVRAVQSLTTESADDKQTTTDTTTSPQTTKEINASSIEEDRSVTSYTSHQYAKELPLFQTTTQQSTHHTTTTDDYDTADENTLDKDAAIVCRVKQYETQQVCHVLVEDFTYAGPRSFVSFDHMVNECEHTLQMKGGNGSVSADVGVEDEVFADSLEPFDLQQISTEF